MINVFKKPVLISTAKDPKDNGTRYYAAYSRKGTADTIALSKQMTEGSSSFTRGEVVGVTLDLPNRIKQALLAGQAVHIDGLGTFKPALTTRDIKEDPKELKTNAITIRSINFSPDSELITALNAEAKFEWIDASKADSEDEDSSDDQAASGGNTPSGDTPSGNNPPVVEG